MRRPGWPRTSEGPAGPCSACCPAAKTAKSLRIKRALVVRQGPRYGRSTDRPTQTNRFSMKCLRHLTAAALLLVAMGPVFAADVVYPPGVRVGLAPLVGLVKARTFTGFETEDHSVKVLLTELPSDAYNEVKTAFSKPDAVGPTGIKPQTLETAGAGTAYYTVETAKDGANTVKRYSMMLSGGTFSGYVAVQIPESASKIYTEDAVRQMFASAETRKEVPVEEQLSMLPFRIIELS